MTDTPRCDEKMFSLPGLPAEIVNIDFARRLERELALARGTLEFYAGDKWDCGCGCCQQDFSEENPAIEQGKLARKTLARLDEMAKEGK